MARKRTSEREPVVSSGMAAAPVRRKTTSSTHAKHAATQPETQAVTRVKRAAKTAADPTVKITAAFAEPTREEVAALAYSYWESRGCQGGTPHEDWVRAELELLARIRSARAVA